MSTLIKKDTFLDPKEEKRKKARSKKVRENHNPYWEFLALYLSLFI